MGRPTIHPISEPGGAVRKCRWALSVLWCHLVALCSNNNSALAPFFLSSPGAALVLATSTGVKFQLSLSTQGNTLQTGS